MEKYGIVKFNDETFARESTLEDNNYRSTKYALIEKKIIPYTKKEGNEVINRIVYSDDLGELSIALGKYKSWYNYPVGIYKDIQGNLRELA